MTGLWTNDIPISEKERFRRSLESPECLATILHSYAILH